MGKEMEQDMKQLVSQAVSGNSQAFEALYQLSAKQVYFTCLSFVKNENDAADLMQETYISALTHLSTLREPERFLPWISQIAANKCRNFLLKKQPEFAAADEILEHSAVDADDLSLPENYISDSDKRKRIMSILKEELSALQYETVILYYYDGLSIEEIAECMECPAGTVGYRLSAARIKIKQGILEYEEESGEALHCYGGFVFFAAFFAAELERLEVPDILENIMRMLSQNVTGAAANPSAATKARRTSLLKSIKNGKAIAGLIAAALVLLVGAGAFVAAVKLRGNEKQSAPSGGNNSNTAEIVSDGVHLYASGFDSSKRWLTMQDFSDGQLDEAPAEAVFCKYPDICADGIRMPVDMEEMLTILNETTSYGTEAKGVGLLTCTDMLISSGKAETFYGQYYDASSTTEDKTSYAWSFSIYNVSDESETLRDCFSQGLYHLNEDDESWRLLGFSDEEVGFDENERNYYDCYAVTLDMLVERFGSPHIVNLFSTYATLMDSFNNLTENQGLTLDSSVSAYLQSVLGETESSYASESYWLGWIFDDYVIYINVQEIYDPSSNEDYPDRQEVIALHVYLYSRELYNIRSAENSFPFDKNQIEELFPDGFILKEQ